MATIENFLRTGAIGPIVLGVSPNDIMDTVGDPDEISGKSNPLLLKYGAVQLTFWRGPKEKVPQLREIGIGFGEGLEIPAFLEMPRGWGNLHRPTERQFRDFMHEIGYLPVHLVEGIGGRQLLFPSHVVVRFLDDVLHSMRLKEREKQTEAIATVPDEREPSVKQIAEMIDEAMGAARAGASRAALLLAWAALEATLRRTLFKAGHNTKVGVQPLILIRELFAAGLINSEERGEIESLRQLRSSLAHGVSVEKLDSNLVFRLATLTGKLLAHTEGRAS